MLHRFASLFFVLLCFLTTQAQVPDNFVGGTITLENDEQRSGLVLLESYDKMSVNVKMKRDSKGKVYLYDSLNVKSIALDNGEAYEKISFVGNKAAIRILARVLVKGRITLWLAQSGGVRYYIITRPDAPGKNYVLQDDRIEDIVQTADEKRIVQHHFFKSFLRLATKDVPAFTINPDNVRFDTNDLVEFISAYNIAAKSENKIYNSSSKGAHFFIVGAGGMSASGKTDFMAQAMFRLYFPKVSRGLSLNAGFNYNSHQVNEAATQKANNYGYLVYQPPFTYKAKVLTASFQAQQNLLQGNVRPYLFLGAGISIQQTSNYNDAIIYSGGDDPSVKSFSVVYGGGIEWNILKNIMIKGEYRYATFSYLPMAGIYYVIR